MFAFARPFTVFAPDPPAGGGAPPAPGADPTPEQAAALAAAAAATGGAGDPPAGDPPAGGAPAEPPPGWTPPTYAEVQAQQSAIAAANRRARELETAQQTAETERQREAGQYKDLYETEQGKTQKLETGIKTAAITSTIAEAAQRLGFRNPTIAARLISTDGIDAELGDDYTAKVDAGGQAELEKRLAAVLAENPELKAGAGGAQLPGAGDPPPGATGGAAGLNADIRRAAGRA